MSTNQTGRRTADLEIWEKKMPTAKEKAAEKVQSMQKL